MSLYLALLLLMPVYDVAGQGTSSTEAKSSAVTAYPSLGAEALAMLTKTQHSIHQVKENILRDMEKLRTEVKETIKDVWASQQKERYEIISLFQGARLVGGPTSDEGRLEVFHNDTWGTVCDKGFNDTDAKVVCHMMGKRTNHSIALGSFYGPGSGSILLTNVNCTGTETSITQCGHRGWGRHDCGHDRDVAIYCGHVAYKFEPKVYRVRLVDGPRLQEGRLEVFYNHTWGSVCDEGFGDDDARVFCRMMGNEESSHSADLGPKYGTGSGFAWLKDVNCTGTEVSIMECGHSGWGRHNCGHHGNVAIYCGQGNYTA